MLTFVKNNKYCETMRAVTAIYIILFLRLVMPAGAAGFFCRLNNLSSADAILEAHMSNAVQDEDGFMWFATWNGLVRYDGYTYYTFKPVQCSDGRISSNRIFNIKRTSDGNLWCLSSDNKLYLFDMRRCQFINMHERLSAMTGKSVKTLTPLRRGTTWVTFRDNTCLRIADKTPFANSLYLKACDKRLASSRTIRAVAQDSLGREWVLADRAALCVSNGLVVRGDFSYLASNGKSVWLIGRDGRIVSVNGSKVVALAVGKTGCDVRHAIFSKCVIVTAGSNGVVATSCRSGQQTQLSRTPSDYVYSDHKGRLWAFSPSNSVEMIVAGKELKKLTAPFVQSKTLMKNPQLIYENAFGQIVLKPESGELSYYDEQSGELRQCRFFENNARVDFVPADIKKFLVDHNKNLWLFKDHESICVTFHPDYFVVSNNPAEQECRMLGLTGSLLWASDRSLSLYGINVAGPPSYMSPDGILSRHPSVMFSQPAYSFLCDDESRVWIGTKGDGLYLFNPLPGGRRYAVEHFLHAPHNPNSLCGDSIYAIYQDRIGRIWLGTYGSGVFTAMKDGNAWTFRRCAAIPDNAKVRCFLEPVDGMLLVGTTDGLLSVDTRRGHKMRCWRNAFRKESWGLKGNDVMKILECRGRVYLCVFGSGISEMQGEDYLTGEMHFRTYTMSADATADQIKSAACDGTNIWVVSDQSITKFSAVDKSQMTFDRSYFTESLNLSEATPVICGGIVTVGTSKGTMSFRSDIASKKKRRKKLVFTGIQYTEDMNIRPLNDIDTLCVSPSERSFSLYLSALDYGSDKPARYRYRMKGYSDEWSYTSENQHAVCYDNILPGEYTLRVETCGADGRWGEVAREIPVIVSPRFVETAWFHLLVLLLVSGVFVALVYAVVYLNRMRRSLQKRYTLLMAVEELTTEMRHKENLRMKEDGDKDFLESNIRFLEENISKEKLAVDDFARQLGMSRTAYYNRMKALTGLSPIEFIRQMRIKKALQLIGQGEQSISEVAYKTGFNDPKYFSRCFKSEVGMSPSAYISSKGKE